MTTWSTVEPETLLAHTHWVGELARRLVRDPNLAEDLAQETCLRALQGAPRAESGLQGWLAIVLRNLVRQGKRGADRRAAREAASARPEATPSTLDLVERLSRHRSLVDALVALDEPYRSTLTRRYFDGQSPAQIAGETAVPVSTVKTRLARGLDLLRTRLETRHGRATDAWLLALAPPLPAALAPAFPGPSGPLGAAAVAAQTALGVVAVSTPLKLTALFTALAAGLYVVLPGGEPLAPKALEQAAAAPVEQIDATALESELGPPRATARAPVTPAPAVDGASEAPPSQEPVPDPAALATLRVEGQVFDAQGLPLSGVHLVLDGGASSGVAPATRSGSGGRFELDVPRSGGVLRCADEDRVTVYSGRVSPLHDRAPIVVVVARHQPLAGRVVDETGRGLSGAQVEVRLPQGFRSRFAAIMDHSEEVRWMAISADDGSFALPGAGAIEGATLSAVHAGYTPFEAPLPTFSDDRLRLVLSRPAVHEATLLGRVVDDAGIGVAEASVSFGIEATVSDAGGFFSFDLRGERSPNRFVSGPPARLIALKEGLQAGQLELELDPQTGLVRAPQGIVLVLSGEPESIRGRVVDSEGRPAAGVQVWLDDATLFALDQGVGSRMVENLLAGHPDSWMTAETDELGRFELRGLMQRAYRLSTMDPATLLMSTSNPIEAGARGVELVLDRDELFETVAGRLIDHGGRPVVGATVHGMLDAFQTRYAGRVLGTRHATTEPVLTDEEGAFLLAQVPRDLAYLRIDGESILPLEYGRGHEGGLDDLCGGRPTELEIRVSRRMHFRVELVVPDEADSLGVLDEAGEPVAINVMQGGGRREMQRVPLLQGSSDALAVTDMARTLVLFAAGEEVRRVPLELQPEILNEVHP